MNALENQLSRRSMIQLLAGLGVAWRGVVPMAANTRQASLGLPDFPGKGWSRAAEEEEVIPVKSTRYVEEVAGKLATMKPLDIAAHVRRLAQEDADWRRKKCLSLRAPEGIMSDSALQLLASTLATRVTEGFPGDKKPRQGTDRSIDEIEAIIIFFAKKLFHAKYVEWRPISNTMANALPLLALTEPGDVIMCQAMQGGGGNASYHPEGPGGLKRLTFINIPPAENFQFDLPALRKLAHEVRPKFIFVGGSYFILPIPLGELREIANEVGARIVYDAAHVALLIAGGVFQQPLEEGADILTISTHKTFGGPVGGMALTNDPALARKMLNRTLEGYLQTRDQNKYVAAAYCFSEVAEFGAENARQVVQNAQAFGEALNKEGFDVLARDKGYTRTHQVFPHFPDRSASKFADRCLDCNILVQTAPLIGDGSPEERRSLRLSVGEITRLGMKQKHMAYVAQFFRRAGRGEESARVARDVEDFLKDFQKPQYSFNV